MSKLRNRVVNAILSPRLRSIDYFKRHPFEVQNRMLRMLLHNGAVTAYGRRTGMRREYGLFGFQEHVPLCRYEDVARELTAVRKGGVNPFWPQRVKWFARSSGTTDSKSKYIPVTADSLRDSQMKAPIDIMAIYCDRYPDSGVLYGKTLTLGGSHRIDDTEDKVPSGDLSSIMIENTPPFAWRFRVPSREVALMDDFDLKLRHICRTCSDVNVTSFSGVPSWNLVLLNKLIEYNQCSYVTDFWPNIELFVHGGVDFRPYRNQYRKIINSEKMKYFETYNASEGFFAIAEQPDTDEMLLMLDYGIFYEFVPFGQIDDPSCIVPLEGVVRGVDYAVIITTTGGLWRYMIGDTVEFTSISPYKIRFKGRTKSYINAFGEEVIIDNVERAMQAACEATSSEVGEYTVAPVYMNDGKKGFHEWLIEFRKRPSSVDAFAEELDRFLRSLNSDYDAKRKDDVTLQRPEITLLGTGTFGSWMRHTGRLGGQNKVPRLSNDRRVADSVLQYVSANPTLWKIK